MEERYLLYLIVLFAVLVFVALIFFSFGSYRSGRILPINTNQSTSVISLSATGTSHAKPSQAQISITINGTGPTTSLAVQNLSATLSLFNSTIYGFINGNTSLVETTYYSVYKPYQYCPVAIPVTNASSSGIPAYPIPSCTANKGYTAVEDILVTLPNIDNVSSFLGAMASAPNIYVTSVSPALSDNQTASLRSTALAAAIANATSQAEALMGLGAVIYSKNVSVNNYYYYPYSIAGAASSGASIASLEANTSANPQFYEGISQVTESVSVVFHYSSR